MTKLEQAARQALGALVRAEAMYGQPNADIQTALREALAEQAEQEPVAWHEPNAYGNVTIYKGWAKVNGWLPLYAAPVRTKDLTDGELTAIWERNAGDWLACFRAVISADREKNK